MIKLTRNKLITELVLLGRSVPEVGKAFGLSSTTTRRIIQNTLAHLAKVLSEEMCCEIHIRPREISIIQAREAAAEIIPDIGRLNAENYKPKHNVIV